MVELIQIYAVITTVVLPWIWLRHRALYRLAMAVYDAAKDKKVTEEEFQEIADKLGEVIYKK